MSRRNFVAAYLGLVVVFLGLAVSTNVSSPAVAAGPRVVTIDPGPLTPGSMATVRWSGYAEGPAYIYLCTLAFDLVAMPLPTDCYGDTLVIGDTRADGTGEAQFEVRSALYPVEVLNEGGVGSRPGGQSAADCRSLLCGVVVSECSALLTSAAHAAYQVPPQEFGSYNDDPYVEIEWIAEDGFIYDQAFKKRPPEPVEEPDPETPIIATGPKVLAAGGDLGAAVYNAWGREVAGTDNIGFDFTALDYTRGVNGLINGTFDMAISGAPLTEAQQQSLTARGQSLVFVPISVSAIGIAYNFFPGLPMQALRLSPRSVAGILDKDVVGVGTDTGGGSIGDDQGRCKPIQGRTITVYTKGGVSEAHLTTSAWLESAVPALWTHDIQDRLPPTQGNSQIFLSNELVVPGILSPKTADGNTNIANFARFGLVDASWASEFGAPMALIQNEAEEWVSPTPEGALATLASSAIGSDNIVQIDYRSTDPDAYPLVSVMYAVAPVSITNRFTATTAAAVRSLLTFFVSPDGQTMAEEAGFVPLPPTLVASAAAAIAQIGSVAPTPPTTTTTTTTTPATTTTVQPETTTTPETTTASTEPTTTEPTATSTPTSPPTTDGSTDDSAASLPAISSVSTNRTTSSSNGSSSGGGTSFVTPSAVPPTTTAPTPSVPTTSVVEEVITETTVPPALDPPTEATPPPSTVTIPADVFTTTFREPLSSPNLPTLGAVGVSVLFAGQGIRLWRVQQRRTRPIE